MFSSLVLVLSGLQQLVKHDPEASSSQPTGALPLSGYRRLILGQGSGSWWTKFRNSGGAASGFIVRFKTGTFLDPDLT